MNFILQLTAPSIILKNTPNVRIAQKRENQQRAITNTLILKHNRILKYYTV